MIGLHRISSIWNIGEGSIQNVSKGKPLALTLLHKNNLNFFCNFHFCFSFVSSATINYYGHLSCIPFHSPLCVPCIRKT